MKLTSKTIKDAASDFLEVFIIVLAVGALSWIFIAEPLEVTGDSMEPTLHNKEQIIVEKASMSFGELTYGDIVVFNSPKASNVLVIKRVIALAGDTVELVEGDVYINGTIIDEPHVNGTLTMGKESLPDNTLVKVPDNAVFVLGDNRENSTDSRDFGPIKVENLIGKAVVVYFPFDNFRKVN